MLLVIHATLAGLTGIREFELSDDEARKLADASKEVLSHYPVGVSEKTLAWINLAVVGGGIYGTRFMAYNVRRGEEKRARTVAASAAAPSSGGTQAPGPQPAAPNGHAAAAAGLDLTPAFLTVPPEGETIL